MTESDYENIAQKCGLYKDIDSSNIILNIKRLEDDYQQDDLINIYNYLIAQTSDADVTKFLIRCIDKDKNSSNLGSLIDILLLRNNENDFKDEQNIDIRIMCAKTIAHKKNSDAVSALLYCLNNKHENYKVRLACADALGKIGDKYAVAPLIEVATDKEEKSVYLRESAVNALGNLGDASAVDSLVKIIEEKQGILDKFTFLKERALESLVKMGFISNERIFRALRSSLTDESAQVRINAIEALMKSDNPRAYGIIKKAMIEDKDIEVKKNALIALYNMRGRSILDEIIDSPDYCDELKLEAVRIINEYEDEETSYD